jgi:putative hydroxymethylpyrimidine transport system substrate-binding protein
MSRQLFIVLFVLPTFLFAKSLQPFTVVLDWFINPDHAPMLVSLQQGFYKQHGLAVKLIAPANPSDGPKLVAAGKADLTVDYQPTLLLQIQEGLPLVRVGTLVNQPLACLVSLKYTQIKDLKGQSIAYSAGGGVNDVLLSTMLHYNGVNMHQVKLVNVSYNVVQGLVSNRVGASTGLMRNFEIFELQQLGFKPHVFYPEKNGFPDYNELVLAGRYQHVDTKKTHAFLTATAQGVAYLRAHPKQTWLTFAKQHPEDNNKLNRKAWFASIAMFAKQPAYFDVKKYQHLMRFFVHKKLISQAISAKRYAGA